MGVLEGESGGKNVLDVENLQSLANSLDLIVGSCNEVCNSNIQWNKDEV